MELRHLRYFIAVAEELSFAKAAERLHIAAPPLHAQIRKLAAEIGTQLLRRQGRSMQLTEAGRVFLEQARKTLAEANRGVEFARRAADGEIGRLSIGYNPVAEFRIFPQIIPLFPQRYPDVRLEFHSFRSAQQYEALLDGEIDLGFSWVSAGMDRFDVHEIMRESFVIVLPAGHRLASKARCSVRDLSNEPLVLFPRSLDPDTYHQIEHLFLSVGAAMNVAYEMESTVSVVNFVAIGSGCSILPDYARKVRQEGVEYRPIGPSDLERSLAVIKIKGARGLPEKFYRFTVGHYRRSRRR